MSDLGSIQRCRDITDDHVNAAIATRDDTRALLDHALSISRPREAGARVLLVFARMASPSCDWLDGALRVELTRQGTETFIDSYAEIGAGLKERVFPRMAFNVPFDEFVVAIQKFPQAIQPLTVATSSDDRMVLSAGEAKAHVPAPTPLGAEDLPTVDAAPKPAAPLAKLKLERRPALGRRISEEIVTKPKGDSRRESTGEYPAMPLVKPHAPAEEEPSSQPNKDDVDKGWD